MQCQNMEVQIIQQQQQFFSSVDGGGFFLLVAIELSSGIEKKLLQLYFNGSVCRLVVRHQIMFQIRVVGLRVVLAVLLLFFSQWVIGFFIPQLFDGLIDRLIYYDNFF
eukprot:TRINITY_DN4055_c0_g1_i5.p4 TRINITY_DN4055_c0_g1~~TRINITY_DN4055_c0_g1_i5.p4  ORF type:complete len:108 (-),score=13.61 TRINITY_DN4055_c0_g1_i5:206-529(-)